MSSMFLNDSELDELTGIARGATRLGVKKTKFQLQAAFLRDRGIAFISNARGKPVVLRSALESNSTSAAPKTGWRPAAVGA